MGMVLPTRGQLATSGHIFGFPNWERECYWPLEVDGREAAKRGQCTGSPPIKDAEGPEHHYHQGGEILPWKNNIF